MDSMPEQPPLPPQFCTFVPNRRYATGKYKYHNTLGHAKAAVVNGGYGKIFQWSNEDGQWILLYDVPTSRRRDRMPWNIEKAEAAAEAARRADAAAERKRTEDMLKEISGL